MKDGDATNRQAISALQPRVASVFVPYTVAADAIIDCIEAEIPLVVAYAEGIPQRDQLRVSCCDAGGETARLKCEGSSRPPQPVKDEIDGRQLSRYDLAWRECQARDPTSSCAHSRKRRCVAFLIAFQASDADS